MSKLTLDALKQRADAVASKDLLSQISGGQQNDCHDEEIPEYHPQEPKKEDPRTQTKDKTDISNPQWGG